MPIYEYNSCWWLLTEQDAQEMKRRIDCHSSPRPHSPHRCTAPKGMYELDCAGLVIEPGRVVFIEGGSVYTDLITDAANLAKEMKEIGELGRLMEAWAIKET